MTTSPLARAARRTGYGLAALLLLAAIAHTVLWWQGTRLLEQEAARWIAAREAEGMAVRHGPPVRGGWPFAARLSLPDAAASGVLQVERQGSVPVSFRTPAIVLEVALGAPRTLVIEVASPFRIAAPGFDATGEARLLRIQAPLVQQGRQAPDLIAQGLVIATAGDRLAAEDLTLVAVRDPAARGDQPALSLLLTANGVDLPASSQPALGARVARAVLDIHLVGMPPGRGSAQAQALAWRDAGGFVQIPRLLLDWGPLSLDADATLALDQAAQPSGEGRARMAGLPATLDRLMQAGLIDRQAAQAGRTIVAFMQRTPAGGGPPVVELPLALRNRVLSAGRLTLLQLPPIAWPP